MHIQNQIRPLIEGQSLKNLLNADYSGKQQLIISEHSKVKELFVLTENLDKAKRVIFQLNTLYKKLFDEIQQLKAELPTIKQEQELQNQLVNQLKEEKQQACEQLLCQIKQIQKEKSEIINLNEELNYKIIQLQETQKGNYQKIDQLNALLQKSEKEKQVIKTENNNQLDFLQKQIQNFKEEEKGFKENIQLQTKEIEELNNLILKLKLEKDKINQENKGIIYNLTQQIQISQSDKQKLQSEFLKQKQENLEALSQLTKQNNDENNKNQKLIEQQNTINKKQEESLEIMSMKIESMNKLTKQLQEQLKLSQDQQNSLNKQIEKLKEEQNKLDQINQQLNKNNQVKDEQIDKQQQEIQQLKADLQKKSDELINIKKLFEDSTQQIEKKQIIINKLEEQRYQDKIIIEKLNKNISEGNTGILAKVDQKVEIKQQKIVSLIDSPYEIIKEYSKKQSDDCFAIAFNKEQTIMVAGSVRNKITVFEFKQGQLNKKQLLSGHTSNYSIYTLYFMTKQNQFISGTVREIGIWSYNNTTQQWYCLQLLKEAHSNSVNRVIMNKNEDLMISCSDDSTIKFWIKKNEWECSQTLTNHTNRVLSICLNESCTQLVSCGWDNLILISQQGSDQKWIVIQSIQVDQSGSRICFIDDNVIVFQPQNGTKMQTYQLDEQRRQFIKSKDIQVQNDTACILLFPMQFNNNKQLLVNKNGYRVNLIRKQNNDFIIEQSIKFDTLFIYGAMTDDFQYLVTWDKESQEFQVRKQQ